MGTTLRALAGPGEPDSREAAPPATGSYARRPLLWWASDRSGAPARLKGRRTAAPGRETPSVSRAAASSAPSAAQRQPVLAVVGAADEDAAAAVDEDALAAAERRVGVDHPVAAAGEAAAGRGRDAGLDLEVAWVGHDARQVEGLLRVEA